MATSMREGLRKVLKRRCGGDKARMVAYRTAPEKARALTRRIKRASKDKA